MTQSPLLYAAYVLHDSITSTIRCLCVTWLNHRLSMYWYQIDLAEIDPWKDAKDRSQSVGLRSQRDRSEIDTWKARKSALLQAATKIFVIVSFQK